MTLRRRLAVRYVVVVGICLILIAGLGYHEFVVEPRVRRELGFPKPSGSQWGEYAEIVFYSLLPIVLTGGWLVMRHSLSPIDDLTRKVERIHADTLSNPLPRTGSGDELDRLTSVFNDMTARLDQAIRQIREFTLHASHELKTPLTVMLGQLETALRDPQPLPPAHREWVQGQVEEVRRLARIVDTLSLLTKADAGAVALDKRPLGLATLLRECLEDAIVLAEPHNITVGITRCEETVVNGDRDRLRQLLLNLVDNAIKYNHPGGTVTLELQRRASRARLTIVNTGEPVPPALRLQAFGRFVRGESARRRGIEGSGLGLAICQWIVREHGGEIEMSSLPDGRTCVAVTLPSTTTTPPPDTQPETPAGQPLHWDV